MSTNEEKKVTSIIRNSTAIGNEDIIIMKHGFSEVDTNRITEIGIDLAIRNVSSNTIASAVFEAVIYDEYQNIRNVVKHTEIELLPKTSRAIRINTLIPQSDKVTSYDIRIVRTKTIDDEKVQFRRYEIKTNEFGEEVRGLVKNISHVKN